MSHFGPVLKDLRGLLGMSQVDLAMALDSTQRHISFLETGRSQPSESFLIRICRELKLSVAQRANLFAASGLESPFVRRAFSSEEVRQTLDMLETECLAHWPYPALVMDATWQVLRANRAFFIMMAPFLQEGNESQNLMSILLGPQFRSLIVNWDEVAPAFYFRLQAGAAQNPELAEVFAKLRREGMFDGFETALQSQTPAPVYVPVTLRLPDGTTLSITSILGRLATVQDALVEGFELEFMMPTDAQSAIRLREALAQSEKL